MQDGMSINKMTADEFRTCPEGQQPLIGDSALNVNGACRAWCQTPPASTGLGSAAEVAGKLPHRADPARSASSLMGQEKASLDEPGRL